MKKKFTLLLFSFSFTIAAFAQNTSTALRVYEIFQNKCVTCHNNNSPEAGLDLEGSGATAELKALEVYENIFQKSPANTYAAAKGYQYIYPGRADKSFIFRKINEDLESTISLHVDEKQSMPPYGSPKLTDVEKELIRQWIFFGAPVNGEVVEEQLLDDFYNLNGTKSFPNGPPPAPDPTEGFQIKMGPFYLHPAGEPGNELEYFQKYALDLPADVDVDRIDIKISGSSHHFILYNFFDESFANQVPNGMRLEPDHSGVGLIAAVQGPTDLKLPEGTAFIWNKDIILDLNSHYINSFIGLTYQAEAYVNVYTHPSGTAAQEMKTQLFAKTNIFILNDENLHVDDQVIASGLGGSNNEIFLWGIMGHTHKYGTGYKVWRRENAVKQELIYDAGCAEGVPDCAFNSFDYQHIPMRYFEPLLPLKSTFSSGIIHEASWVNDGPEPVWFGSTSKDEMMVLVVMYTTDTVGIVTDTREPLSLLSEQAVKVYPNPMRDYTTFEFPEEWGAVDLQLFDFLGRTVFAEKAIAESKYDLHSSRLTPGMYVYHIQDKKGKTRTGKLLVEE